MDTQLAVRAAKPIRQVRTPSKSAGLVFPDRAPVCPSCI